MIDTWTFALVASTALACLAPADDPLPSGPGLAANHPGDVGIAKDEAVVFSATFDEGSLAEVLKPWESVSNEGGRVLSLSDDVPFPGLGGQSLQMTAHPGKDTGGHLYTRLPRGLDRVFVRFYVKFPEPANYIHHFVHVGGYHPSTAWPQGGAGERPEGDERFTVGIEPFGRSGRVPPPGDWNLYTYWQDMKRSADGRYWGNGITPPRQQPAPVGKWQCVELMIRLNAPDQSDGALALWLDGEPVLDARPGTPRGPWTGLGFEVLESGGEPFEGFRFRSTEDLQVNFLWMLHYVTETNQARNRVDDPNRDNPVRFDHVVVATEYIGPVAPDAK